MRELGLAARRKRRRKSTTRPGKGRWRAPDLVRRDFPAAGLNQKWYGDGTDLDTGEGKLYLDSVQDGCSRRILGYAIGEHHDAALAYGALAMAVAVRGGQVPGVIFHTDQGSERGEYTAGPFRQACERLGVTQSMGRPGSALDNAVIEAWHSTLEFELRQLQHFATRAQAGAAALRRGSRTTTPPGLLQGSPACGMTLDRTLGGGLLQHASATVVLVVVADQKPSW